MLTASPCRGSCLVFCWRTATQRIIMVNLGESLHGKHHRRMWYGRTKSMVYLRRIDRGNSSVLSLRVSSNPCHHGKLLTIAEGCLRVLGSLASALQCTHRLEARFTWRHEEWLNHALRTFKVLSVLLLAAALTRGCRGVHRLVKDIHKSQTQLM